MTHQRSARTTRTGFTLVEILLVIVIILVLMSLLISAGAKALTKTRQVRNRSDISGLATALENFKARFGFYPPSRMILCEAYDHYFVGNNRATGRFKSRLHEDSVATLQRMFPRMKWEDATAIPPRPGVDWNGDGRINPSELIEAYLEGDQCLVFFLGGIPGVVRSSPSPAQWSPSVQGFSTNPGNPALNSNERIGPFYSFSGNRLVNAVLGPAGTPVPIHDIATAGMTSVSFMFYSYLDTYGSQGDISAVPGPGGVPQAVVPVRSGAPYAYFSSYKSANGYNRYFADASLAAAGLPPTVSDCSQLGKFQPIGSWTLLPGIPQPVPWPYAEALPTSANLTYRYINPNSFQIVSAGANGVFGPGTNLDYAPGGPNPPSPWTPATASAVYPATTNPPISNPPPDHAAQWLLVRTFGHDDQANFYDTLLGYETK